jgi:hypothetical protein
VPPLVERVLRRGVSWRARGLALTLTANLLPSAAGRRRRHACFRVRGEGLLCFILQDQQKRDEVGFVFCQKKEI